MELKKRLKSHKSGPLRVKDDNREIIGRDKMRAEKAIDS